MLLHRGATVGDRVHGGEVKTNVMKIRPLRYALEKWINKSNFNDLAAEQ